MTHVHLARCKGMCGLIYLVIKEGATAKDLLKICGDCPQFRPIRKELKC